MKKYARPITKERAKARKLTSLKELATIVTNLVTWLRTALLPIKKAKKVIHVVERDFNDEDLVVVVHEANR